MSGENSNPQWEGLHGLRYTGVGIVKGGGFDDAEAWLADIQRREAQKVGDWSVESLRSDLSTALETQDSNAVYTVMAKAQAQRDKFSVGSIEREEYESLIVQCETAVSQLG